VDEVTFPDLLDEVTRSGDRFGHRQHLHLAWLAVRRYEPAAAVALVSEGIRQTARYAGVPQKYNETVSRAWVEAVAYHGTQRPDLIDFDDFVVAFPGLLDKRLLATHYRPATVADPAARRAFIAPDLVPFPGPTRPPETRRAAGGHISPSRL
jgi:hypothetical protein